MDKETRRIAMMILGLYRKGILKKGDTFELCIVKGIPTYETVCSRDAIESHKRKNS